VNCESDFVARTDGLQGTGARYCHAHAASDPKYVVKEDVTPEAFAAREGNYLRRRSPAASREHREKMVAARWRSSTRRSAFWSQPFIKDQTVSISQLIAAKIGKMGENIAVRRFARFKVGDVGETIAIRNRQSERRVTQAPDGRFFCSADLWRCPAGVSSA